MTSEDIYNDPLLEAETEYYGDDLSKESKTNALKVLRDGMKPFAKVDIKKRTVTFLTKEDVKKNYVEFLEKELAILKENFDNGITSIAEYRFRRNSQNLGLDDIFYNNDDGYCRKFAGIAADYLAGYIPQTLYIGEILDAKI